MELVALSDRQLRALALSDPELKRVFQGVYPSDRLPERPPKTTRGAYIVNTDPAGEPGQHWLALWTDQGGVRSDGQLRVAVNRLRRPGIARMDREALEVRGAYRQDPAGLRQSGLWALCLCLPARPRAWTVPARVCGNDDDYVWNDHRVGQRVRAWIETKLDEAAMDEPDGPDTQRCVSRRCLLPSLKES